MNACSLRRTRIAAAVLFATAMVLAAAPTARAETLEHVVTFDERDLSIVLRDDGYHVVTLSGCDVTREVGRPQLPVLPLTLALPAGARVSRVEVVGAESIELLRKLNPAPAQHPRILPVPGLDLPVPRWVGPDASVYGGSEPYPATVVEVSSRGRLAGSALVGLIVHPVQFLPESGKLRFFKKVTLKLDYRVEDSSERRPGRPALRHIAGVIADNRLPPAAEGMSGRARESFLDDGDFEHVIIIGEAGLQPALATLSAWKTAKGVPSTTVQVSWIDATYPGGDKQQRIRAFILDAREAWGAEWFLLAGDEDWMPARRAYAMTCEAGGHADEDAIACDLYYADLDGDWDADGDGTYGELADGTDLYPDVFVGRAPLESAADAEAFADKIIEYERAAFTDYQLDMLMAAEVLWTDPFTDSGIALNRIDRDYVPPRYDPVTKLYETLGNESVESVKTALSAGSAHFLHSGHAWYNVLGCGDGYLSRWEIVDLTNQHAQPVVYSIGCWPAAFDLGDYCIAERFVQSPNGGGVAFIGNSRYGWASPGNPGYGYSERFMQAFYAALFTDGIENIGAALAAAKASFIPLSQAENVYRWHQYELNLLGDPEMPVWTDLPAELTVSHPDSVVPGTSVMSVGVRTSAGPLEGALVCVANGSDVYERARTSTDGTVDITVDTVLPDSLGLTVTARNCRPYEASVPVVFTGAFIRPIGCTVDDSSGNGDGVAGPGETIALSVNLSNLGTDEAGSVEAVLSSSDPMVDVLDATSEYGDVTGGATASSSTPYTLSIAPDCGDRHVALLDVAITSETSRTTWTGTVSFTVGAPVLTAVSYTMDDTWGGDGDGLAEPGENVTLMVEIGNGGLVPATAPYLSLSSDDPSIQVISGNVTLADVAPGTSTQAVFEIQVAPGSPEPSFPSLAIEATTMDGHSSSDTLKITVGSVGFSHNFEGGSAGWTQGGPSGTWTLTGNRTHSGSSAWYVGEVGTWQYVDGMECHLDSPEFVRGAEAELSFWCWYEFPIYHEDGFHVQILESGAAIDTLDFIGSGGALDLLGSIGNDWLEYTYDLPGEPGDTLRIRFLFTSDEVDVAEGVYIDDVSVTVTAMPTDTGTDGQDEQVPAWISLQQNHPNPFRSSTLVSYSLRVSGTVRLAVYNVQGRLIRTLIDGVEGAGEHEASWDGRDDFGVDVAAGVYLLRLTLGEQEETRKMILIR